MQKASVFDIYGEKKVHEEGFENFFEGLLHAVQFI